MVLRSGGLEVWKSCLLINPISHEKIGDPVTVKTNSRDASANIRNNNININIKKRQKIKERITNINQLNYIDIYITNMIKDIKTEIKYL